MMATSILIQAALLVHLGAFHNCMGGYTTIHFYNEPFYNGTVFHTFGDYSDFAASNFDDQTRSITYHAAFILYEYRNYNAENPDGAVVTRSNLIDYSLTYESNSSLFESTSSVRVVGHTLDECHYASVQLFENENFGGLRTELVSKFYNHEGNLNYSDYMSLAILGDHSWTFYDEHDFKGRADCVTGASDVTSSKFLKNSAAIGFSLNGKRSVQEGIGCFPRRDVPVRTRDDYSTHYWYCH